MSGSVLVNISEILGVNLVSMDRNGFSDPYIKIIQNEVVLHKSKPVKNTLNPKWSEIHIRIDSLNDQLCIKVKCKSIFSNNI